MRSLFALATALCVGCGGADDTETAGSGGAPAAECPPGARWVNDRCLDAGIQDNGCPAGEVGQSDGACAPAGVPPEACAAGFQPFEDGCAPILPSGPCDPGRMATPGETRCREIAPCGTTEWGAIPVESNTQYVDASYASGDSDGTALKPWTSIQAAVDVADSGAIVAIAAGSYAEDVAMTGKATRLWGRCPDMVEIVVPSETNGIFVGVGADGSEVHDLAIRGDALGIAVIGALEIRLDRVWIHDTTSYGGYVEGRSELSVTRSLFEATSFVALHVAGGTIGVDASMVRDTQPHIDGTYGRGINVQVQLPEGLRGQGTVRGSVVSNNHRDGIFIGGADAVVENTVVSATQSEVATATLGAGMTAQAGPNGERATLSVTSCVVSGNQYGGIEAAGADASIVATTVRDTVPQSNGDFGSGLAFYDASDERANATVSHCAVSGNHGNGVWMDAADAVIEGTVVRDTQPSLGVRGRGLNVTEHGTGPSQLTLIASVVTHNHEAGLVVSGSKATLDGVALRDTQPDPMNQLHGVGVLVRDFTGGPGEASLAKSVVSNNHDVGIFVSSATAVLDATLVHATKPLALDGSWGVGVLVQPSTSEASRSSFTMRDSVVDESYQNAAVVFASDALIEHSSLLNTLPQANTQDFGDGVTIAGYGLPAHGVLRDSRVEASARVGVGNFGAVVTLESMSLECNRIHLDAEPQSGVDALFEDLGGNRCGCASERVSCKASSAGITPPEPIAPP